MTEKEFNLSEKFHFCSHDGKKLLEYEIGEEVPLCISEKDVKEFIKRLKDEINRMKYYPISEPILIIDKLAGDKLI